MTWYKNSQFGQQSPERRFRGSIYVDIWVPETSDPEHDREQARLVLEKLSSNIPNSNIGDVASFKDEGLSLDRDI